MIQRSLNHASTHKPTLRRAPSRAETLALCYLDLRAFFAGDAKFDLSDVA